MVSIEPVRSTYFTQSEPHDAGSPKTAPRLRACLMLHLLFAPRLVVGDSQALNNSAFRALVQKPRGTVSLTSDIRPLLADGDLVIAKRSGRTFAEIRAGQADRGVHGVPRAKYAALLDDVAKAHAWEWDEPMVAEEFKANSLIRLSEAITGSTADRSELSRVRSWIKDQGQLNYNELRKHLVGFSGRTSALVDELVGIEYRLSLPNALQLPTADSSTGKSSPFGYVSLEEPTQVGEIGCWVLRPEALAKLPVAAVQAAAQLQASKEVKEQLARIEVGAHPDLEKLVWAFEELIRRLELSAIEMAEGGDAAALKEISRRPARLRWWRAMRYTAVDAGVCFGVDVLSGVPGRWSMLVQLISLGASWRKDINDARKARRVAEHAAAGRQVEARRRGAGLLKRLVLPPQ
ncbi:hypothetical protein [Kribbella sp. NBC_00889]|uniref:hypothetical protein n=1 Tax=Kribbella sp. NBC_00889 TaxID=2975974 RepID=UPI00386E17EF|nr:hypothetical protein OG817_00120 [Kribbella sp. NBC_00889]